jgi:hypothetical protein
VAPRAQLAVEQVEVPVAGRAASGDVEGALADLHHFGDGSWQDDPWRPPFTWAPDLSVAALDAAPELKTVRGDPRWAKLVEHLAARAQQTPR